MFEKYYVKLIVSLYLLYDLLCYNLNVNLQFKCYNLNVSNCKCYSFHFICFFAFVCEGCQ